MPEFVLSVVQDSAAALFVHCWLIHSGTDAQTCLPCQAARIQSSLCLNRLDRSMSGTKAPVPVPLDGTPALLG